MSNNTRVNIMKIPLIDGQSIDRFIPVNLRHMFYRHFMPQYKYAIHDGYAPYGFSTDGLVLYLPLWALKDSAFKSVDAYKTTATVTTATWTPTGRDFNPLTPDYVEIPAAFTQLNFTSEDFSIIARVYIDSLDVHRMILCRSLNWVQDGYMFMIHTTKTLRLYTCQGGVSQATTSSAIVDSGAWYTLGASRAGAAVKTCINGIDRTSVPAVHINPTSCSQSAKIGIHDTLIAYPFDGKMEFLMVYNRALSELEHLNIHNISKWRG